MLTLWDDIDRTFFRPDSYRPLQVELQDTGEAILLTAEVHGVKRDGVDIQTNNSVLTLSAESSGRKKSYALRLPTYVDQAGITAALEDGILTVRMPKRESDKPRKIPLAQSPPASV